MSTFKYIPSIQGVSKNGVLDSNGKYFEQLNKQTYVYTFVSKLSYSAF